MRRLVLVTLLSASVIGCTTQGEIDGAVGTAEARITQVPSNVGCISITAAAGRSVTDNFDVTAGQSAVGPCPTSTPEQCRGQPVRH